LSWLKEAQRIGHEDDDDEDDDDIERVVWWLLNELFFDGCVAPSDELVSPTTVLCYVVFCFFDTCRVVLCCVTMIKEKRSILPSSQTKDNLSSACTVNFYFFSINYLIVCLFYFANT
jgi:hypothetical protein